MTKVDESDRARDTSRRRSESDDERTGKRNEDSTFRDILRRKRRRGDRLESGRRREQTRRRRRRQSESENTRKQNARSERDRTNEQQQTECSRRERTVKKRQKSNHSGSGPREEGTHKESRTASETADEQTSTSLRRRGSRETSSAGLDERTAPRGGTSEGTDASEAADDRAAKGASANTDHSSNDSAGEPIEPQSGGVEAGAPSRRASAARVKDVERIREISRQIVDAVRQGRDQNRRQVVFVDARVPGGGEVRIRLRRDGDAFEARMRADSDDLARTLRHHESELHDAARESDVTFSSIDIVS